MTTPPPDPLSALLRKVGETPTQDVSYTQGWNDAIRAVQAEGRGIEREATPAPADDVRAALAKLLDSLENNCGRHPVWEAEMEAARLALEGKT